MTRARGERAIEPAEVISTAGDIVRVRAGEGLPQGSRVGLSVSIREPGSEGSLELAGKVAGLGRAPDGGFEISIRLHSLSRAYRRALERACDRGPLGCRVEIRA